MIKGKCATCRGTGLIQVDPTEYGSDIVTCPDCRPGRHKAGDDTPYISCLFTRTELQIILGELSDADQSTILSKVRKQDFVRTIEKIKMALLSIP